jgi:type VI secretion system protein VasI
VKRSLAVAMQVAVLMGPSVAQDDLGAATRAAFCSTVEGTAERLACFDKAFPRGDYATTAAAVQTAPALTSAAWAVETGTSTVDGTPTISAMLTPAEASGLGVGRGSITLILRCAENTTSVSFSTDPPITDDAVPVTVGIGDAPASSSSWTRAKTGGSIGLWRGATAIPFIRAMPNDGRLMVRIGEPSRMDAQFNLGNVGDVTRQIAETCKWPVPPPAIGVPQDAPVELGIQ